MNAEVYLEKKNKAKDIKDSAYSLLIVGFIGFICDVLVAFDVIKVPFGIVQRLIVCILLAMFFITLILVGIHSFNTLNIVNNKADKEEELTQKILSWAQDNITREEIDKATDVTFCDDTDESVYFIRNEVITNRIKDKYLNLEDNYVDYIAECVYQNLFEEN